MKLEIKYPQLIAEFKTIEVDDDKAEQILNGSSETQSEFIKAHLDDLEIQHLVGDISGALEYGFAHVKASK